VDGVNLNTKADLNVPIDNSPAIPMSAGIPESITEDVSVTTWNDLDRLTASVEKQSDEIAAIIMEPIMCNTGSIWPKPGYLEGVENLCKQHEILLILDEVITGFRVDLGGAQKLFNIMPDIATFGKAAGAGLPLSIVAGRAD